MENKHLKVLRDYLNEVVNIEEVPIKMSFQKKTKHEKIKVVCGIIGGVASVGIENKTLNFTLFFNGNIWNITGVYTTDELEEIKNLITKL